jgi:D-alanine-D-alanine ligase
MLPAVMFGGPSPEHDVSVLTGLQAARALTASGTRVEAIYWSKSGSLHQVDPGLEASDFADGVPRGAADIELGFGVDRGFAALGRMGRRRSLGIDVVLNCCHGGPGEDGTLQAALDLAGLRYTGPTHAGAALGMDKLAFSSLAAAVGLAVLPRAVLGPESPDPHFDGPYIVKPRFGGSSIGIEVVADVATARALRGSSPHLRDGGLVEPYLPDADDLEISVRTHPGVALSPIARPLRTVDGGRILSYGDKYLGGEGMASTPRELPAKIDGKVAAAVVDAATALVDVAGLRSLCRLDFLLDGDDLWVNEVNTVPGSLSLYLWEAAGASKADVLRSLLDEAAASLPRRFSAEGSDGRALRAAGSIASKLA